MAATTKVWLNDNAPQVDDVDLNGFKNENNNLIVSAGLPLVAGDNDQTTESISAYAAGGAYYQESGAADAYILNPVGSKLAPKDYFEGMHVSFLPQNDSTGPSTIKVGILAVVDLLNGFGLPLKAGSLDTGIYVSAYYDGAAFRIIEAHTAPGRSARVRMSAIQVVLNGGADKVNFDTVVFDPFGYFDTAADEFKVPTAGIWEFNCNLMALFDVGAVGTGSMAITIQAATFGDTRVCELAGSGADSLLSGTTQMQLAQDETVTVEIGNSTGVSRTFGEANGTPVDATSLQTLTEFSIKFIGS